MSLPVLAEQLYDYFISPALDEYVFRWGAGENEDCHIWLGAVYEDKEGKDIPVLFPVRTHHQMRDFHVARMLLHKQGKPNIPFRMLELEFIHTTCGNSLCVNPDHLCYTPPPETATPVPGEGRKRIETDEETLNTAYLLYTVHGQTLDQIIAALPLKISRATLHRRLQERKDTYV